MERISNEEKAKQIAKGLAVSDEYPHDYLSAYAGAMQAMQWKDEEHAQEKQEWIDNACKLLEGVRLDYYSENTKEFIEDFKKAMLNDYQ